MELKEFVSETFMQVCQCHDRTKESLQDFSSVTSVEFFVPVVFPVSR